MASLDLSRLSASDRKKVKAWSHYVRDPAEFVFGCCKTFDEVDLKNPVKPFPRKEYLEYLVHVWQTERLLCLVKSRRMVVTWLLLALDLWLTMFHDHASVYVVSDEQAKSDKLLARVKFLYDHLPSDFYKPEMIIHKGGQGDPKRIDFPAVHSKIEGLSQDPEAIRQEGATLLHIEELQIWQWPEQSWRAIMPAIMGGGRIIVVGTPAAGTFFEKLVFDRQGRVAGDLPSQTTREGRVAGSLAPQPEQGR
jgi:hypothetical protein